MGSFSWTFHNLSTTNCGWTQGEELLSPISEFWTPDNLDKYTIQFGQMRFTIWTNTSYNFLKCILQVYQMYSITWQPIWQVWLIQYKEESYCQPIIKPEHIKNVLFGSHFLFDCHEHCDFLICKGSSPKKDDFLDAIASPSSYPCQSVSQSVSEWVSHS